MPQQVKLRRQASEEATEEAEAEDAVTHGKGRLTWHELRKITSLDVVREGGGMSVALQG